MCAKVRREGNRRKRKRKPERASEAVDPSTNGLHALHAAALRPTTGMTLRRHSRAPHRDELPDDEDEDEDEDEEDQEAEDPPLSCVPRPGCLCNSWG